MTYGLTKNQMLVWNGHQLHIDRPVFHEVATLHIAGAIDVDRFGRAWQCVVDRTDALRMVIEGSGDEPVQRVLPPAPVTLQYVDLSATPDPERELDAWIHERRRKCFDLSRQWYDTVLLKLSDDHYAWYLCQHQILGDATSAMLMFRRLGEWYAHLDSPAADPGPYPGFLDYVEFERTDRTSARYQRAQEFWNARTANPPPAVTFFDTRKPRYEETAQERITVPLGQTRSAQIRDLARRPGIESRSESISVYSIFAAVLSGYLHRISGNDRVSLGVPSHNRGLKQFIESSGLLMEQHALFIDVDGDDDVASLAAKVRQETLDVKRHQPYAPGNPGGRLYDVRLNFLKGDFGDFAGLPVRPRWHHSGHDTESIAIAVHELDPSGYTLEIDFNVVQFTPSRRQSIVGHVVALLDAWLCDPSTRLKDIEFLSDDERDSLVAYDGTRDDTLGTGSIIEWFDDRVRTSPDRVAVEDEKGVRASYDDVWLQMEQVAAGLEQRGIGRGDLVGVMLRRTARLPGVLLGVLRSGAAYLPLDPDFPLDRLRYMVEDGGAALIISDQDDVVFDGVPTVSPQDVEAVGASASPHVLPRADDPAYVLYTSGSTGRPKGVEITHGALHNFIGSMRREPGLDADDVLLAVTTLSFDISGLELFLPLCTGARIVIASRDTASDGHALAARLAQCGATAMQATPATWRMLIESGWNGRLGRVLCGGEALPAELARALTARADEVWNLYGPTETTVWSTIARIAGDDHVVVGRPIANTNVYVLDRYRQLAPQGMAGEVWIGGAGVARGYRNRPELTAERFLPDPFAIGSRMYRTGDLGRWNRDGQLEHLGRIDDQVKVHGYRIEPGEVESALEALAEVRQAVVTARDDRLVAYVVFDREIDVADVRRRLGDTLPRYMVPAVVVPLDALPLTANGKVDRRALPDPQGTERARVREYEAPQGEIERTIAEVLEQVLGIEHAGRHDDFFELGGHSLLAVQVVTRLKARGILMPLRRLMSGDDIARLGAAPDVIRMSAEEEVIPPPSVSTLPVPGVAQERLWILSQLEEMGSAYNHAIVLRLRGELDRDALDRTLTRIVERHETLRSCYPDVNGTMVVRIAPPERITVPSEDAAASTDDALRTRITQWNDARYDLERGPLFRSLLLRVADDDHVLALGMHHIITDGWSWSVLLRELSALYREHVTNEPAHVASPLVSYFDFAAWQRNRLAARSDVIARDIAYWKEQLRNLPVLELPASRPRPAVQSHRGATVSFEIDAALKTSLEQTARRESITLFMMLLGIYQLLLARLSGQDDIIVGIPEAGRRYRYVEGLIGCFVNTLAIRTTFDDELTVSDLLDRVRQKVLGAIDHAGVPFDRIVSEVNVQRDLSRSPVFQAMFSFQTVDQLTTELTGLRVTPLDLARNAAMFDLTMWVRESGDGLRCDIEYATDLFDREFIAQCAQSYLTLLDAAARTTDARAMDLPILTPAETARLQSIGTGPKDESLVRGSFLEWVEAHVRTAPERCAIEDESGRRWSYGELWSYAARIAIGLAARGVEAGDIVGVRMERGAPMLGVVLGIMRRRAGYLPLDPAFPTDRLAYMVENSSTHFVISDDPSQVGTAEIVAPDALISAATMDATDIDAAGTAVAPTVTAATAAGAIGTWSTPHEDDLAYVLYTSGSTGKPKGVEITHGAVRNFLGAMRTQPGLDVDDVLFAVTTLSFDISGLELFLPLCTGSRIFIASKETTTDGHALAQRLADSGATTLQATPATWRLLLNAGWEGRLRRALSGGEALPEDLARQIASHTDEIWNLYGPTETTIWSTVERFDGSPVLVGQPIANTRIYVLDRLGQLVPEGVHGEIWIAGAGLARGYRSRPDLTAERFLEDPFVPGQRMYRTGDLGRWRGDRLEHLGRLDFQVKIRGFRIELGEIEAALEAFPEVRQAVVTAPGQADDRRLVAFVTLEDGHTLSVADVRRRLGTMLPQYMVPSAIIALDTFPLTPNGKVDRKALPDPLEAGNATLRREYDPPQGEIEELIASVWRELLGIDRVSRTDNFFEIGGHSLLVIQVVARLRSRFRDLTIANVFQHKNLASFAEFIATAAGRPATLADVADRARQQRAARERLRARHSGGLK